jgi:2-dehydro-3-deoxygalactonokinase
MKEFISCDWGTSALRIRLIKGTNDVAAEIKTNSGIASIYKLWQNQKVTDRFSFFRTILSEQIAILEQKCGYALDNATVVISGMASSSIGMIELPYREIPFLIDGTDLLTHVINASHDFKHKMIIIAGVSSADDVMRGEETQLVGCNIESTEDEHVIVFPGTHSKHVVVKHQAATGFKTYMTGELFDLLCNKSILSGSVKKDNIENEINPYFINGVAEGAELNFLNIIFHVRTNQLFAKLEPLENYHYLSGLLIGTELKDLLQKDFSLVTLVSTGALSNLYSQALHTLGIQNFAQKDADEALIKGQSILLQNTHNSKI